MLTSTVLLPVVNADWSSSVFFWQKNDQPTQSGPILEVLVELVLVLDISHHHHYHHFQYHHHNYHCHHHHHYHHYNHRHLSVAWFSPSVTWPRIGTRWFSLFGWNEARSSALWRWSKRLGLGKTEWEFQIGSHC